MGTGTDRRTEGCGKGDRLRDACEAGCGVAIPGGVNDPVTIYFPPHFDFSDISFYRSTTSFSARRLLYGFAYSAVFEVRF